MSTATVSRDLSPATLAAEAARLARQALAQHNDDGAHRRALRKARDAASDLADALKGCAFNERARLHCRWARESLHEAAVVGRAHRAYWLVLAALCLDQISGGRRS